MIDQSRRSFLLSSCALALVASPVYGHEKNIRVRIDAPDEPLVARAAAILKDRIEARCAVNVVESRRRADIVLDIDTALPREAFRIDQVKRAVRISGGSANGLIYGIGKFLRTSGYDGDTFAISTWRGVSEPQSAVRGMYFASHFRNWYCQATDAEIARYMEDLALWGANAIMAVYPFISIEDWNDPKADPAMEMLLKYAKSARDLGIQFATGLNNAFFTGVPEEIRAAKLPDPTHRRGNSGHPVCPSNPAGQAYLMENSRILFEKLAAVGLDILVLWPYDEGGCACSQCAPWGSNGYYKLSKAQSALARQYFPKLKTVLSTWMFDTPPEGEWQGLTDELKKENGWLDYILADAHNDFPRYPLDVCVPGDLPLLNFPEISMWGNWPWGGMGANPLPGRFQRLWDQVKQTVRGGFPYSEGIYEDMNKAQVLQYYWNAGTTAADTLSEYARYEFGADAAVTAQVMQLLELLERSASASYTKEAVDKAAVQAALQLAESIHASRPDWVKQSWRWEILHLRAVLDNERYVGAGLESAVAESAMLRLVEIYHCELVTDDPYHHRVRPKLKGAVTRTKEL